jgi:nucleotide-binding universal stress UspA family protein
MIASVRQRLDAMSCPGAGVFEQESQSVRSVPAAGAEDGGQMRWLHARMGGAWIGWFTAWRMLGPKALAASRRCTSSGWPPRAALAEGAGKTMPGIVVSADGSADSQQALEWAMTHAALEHAPLTVLTVHQVAASAWTGSPIIYPRDRHEAEKAMRATEKSVITTMSKLGDSRPSSVTVRASIGQPAHALIEASHDADMIVVGKGGHFTRSLPRSVSSHVMHHAACPVVVVSGQR